MVDFLQAAPATSRSWSFRARQVFDGLRLHSDSAVWGKGDRIEGFSPWREARGRGCVPPRPTWEFPDALLTPGFVNAHCHLEWSFLRGWDAAGLEFVEWLERIVAARRALSPGQSSAAIPAALRELAESGCAYVADISSMDTALPFLLPGGGGVEGQVFFEVIEFHPGAAEASIAARLEAVEAFLARGGRVGLSPHAPYTTTPALLRAAASAARQRRIPLCIHCGETPEEHRFLLDGDGPLRRFLDAPGLLPAGWTAPGCSPVACLERACIFSPRGAGPECVLLVHMNTVDDEDLRRVAACNAAVVVCPGTHLYFRRGEFPLRRLLRAGIPTLLGTDGLSSNDRLSMWAEIRRAAELTPDAAVERLFAMATSEAARVLGIAHCRGSLQPGQCASFAVISSPQPAPPLESPGAREWLFSPETIMKGLHECTRPASASSGRS
jgi:cytosine/adenosine deaminase-related metal-dependent hydrolase